MESHVHDAQRAMSMAGLMALLLMFAQHCTLGHENAQTAQSAVLQSPCGAGEYREAVSHTSPGSTLPERSERGVDPGALSGLLADSEGVPQDTASTPQQKDNVDLTTLTFTALDDKPFHLTDFQKSTCYVLAFITNTCPIARRYVPRLVELEKAYREKGVRFLAVNVGVDESLEDVRAHVKEFGITFTTVKDDTGDATRALGMTRTPEVAVLDAKGKLHYRGRIDDQYRLGGVKPNITNHDLRDALDAVLEGKSVKNPRVPADGCHITFPK